LVLCRKANPSSSFAGLEKKLPRFRNVSLRHEDRPAQWLDPHSVRKHQVHFAACALASHILLDRLALRLLGLAPTLSMEAKQFLDRVDVRGSPPEQHLAFLCMLCFLL
jgi:hypothetical protein